MKKLTIPVLLAILLTLSCTRTPPPPSWTSGDFGQEFPNVKYMVGLGSASDMTSAKDQARAEIAKQFSVRVEQLAQTLQDYTGMEGERGNNWILRSTISELTRSYTDETIAGIEIRDTFVHPESGICHALAILDRGPAVMRLEMRIIDIDRDISAKVQAAGAAKDKLHKLRPLLKALELMKEREIKNNQLTVVNATGQGVRPEIGPADLNKLLNGTLASIRVAVSVAGESTVAMRVREAIVRSLGNGRLTVTDDTGEADILVSGKATMLETNPGNKTGFVFAKIRASLELVNQLDSSTFGVIEHELRDGALTWTDALDKTQARLAEKIVAEFNNKLYDYMSL